MSAAAEGVFAHWPNRITAIRFFGALVLFVLLGAVEERWLGDSWVVPAVCFVLFVAVAATDWLDGHLARKHGTVTAFGRIADPFVDKILIVGSLTFLAVLPWGQPFLPGWIVVTVLAREFLVTGIRGYVESVGLEFPADRSGKLKLVLQCMAVGAILARAAVGSPDWLATIIEWIAHAGVWSMLVLSASSGLGYIVKAKGLLGARAAGDAA
jgi:CDP-diacylglycerol---glycerol-3-phosphate 3-phosphatidyltransferase